MLPIDRTAKSTLDANLVNGILSDAPKIRASENVVYDTIDELNAKVDGLVGSSALSPYPPSNFNKLINGNFDVAQRGTSFTNPTNNQYTLDRIYTTVANVGTLPTSIIHSQQVQTPGDITGSYYFYRINPNGAGSGFGANDGYSITQKIENGTRYLCGIGKKVTLSFLARSSIAGKKIGVFLTQFFGTGGSPSSGTNANGTNFTLTSTWTKYTVTFSTDTLVGKIFGTNNDDSLAVNFVAMWGAASYGVAVNSAGVAETFVGAGNIDIAQAQVNAGAQVLPFQPRSFAEELALCQRYYELAGAGFVGRVFSGVRADISGSYKVQKRISPTITLTSASPTLLEISVAQRAGTASTINLNFKTVNGCGVYIDGFTGMTAPNMVQMIGDYIALDAEL